MGKKFDKFKYSINKNSPTILAITAVVGLGVSVFLSFKTAPKLKKDIEKAKKKAAREHRKVTPLDYAKSCGIDLIPVTAAVGTTAFCIIFGNSISSKRIKVLTGALTASEQALLTYKNTMTEELGEKKAKEIQNKVTKKQVEETPPTSSNVCARDGGRSLIFDPMSGRYFWGEVDKVKLAVEKMNTKVNDEFYVTKNDFYDLVNECHDLDLLERTSDGELVGWDDRCRIELNDNASGTVPPGHLYSGMPYWAIQFWEGPFNDFRSRRGLHG